MGDLAPARRAFTLGALSVGARPSCRRVGRSGGSSTARKLGIGDVGEREKHAYALVRVSSTVRVRGPGF
jgi:hypothetical protein